MHANARQTAHPDASHIETSSGATSFIGPDAIALYATMQLRSAITLYANCGLIPTRGVTITKMLARASQITGKKYKRGHALVAANDLKTFCDVLAAALPIINKEG